MTQPIPSSSNFTCHGTYSVFLSFRGIDTRMSFAGHLYKALCDKGIETFIDDEELQKGEEITPALLEAIEDSTIAIVIFSANYGSSSFCLDELVKILEVMVQKHRLVLPIFYKVEPSDVRHQKGTFGEAFDKLIERRFKNDMDKVQRWKSALKVAADLSGWHFYEGYDYEYKFINQIVDEVSKKTTRIRLHVAHYPVGLESRVQEVGALLETESCGGVNMVGIYGIGGIGKTTIACAVYNLIADDFEGVCFLNDIRENSITRHDLAQLQKKLLVDILREKDINLGSVKEGTAIIKHRLRRKKVLLILDDVNKLEQLQTLAGELDWLGFGSKIIITTRDKHLLDAHCVEQKYEVVGLNHKDALKLFCWNAFKKEKVDPSYMNLIEDALSYSNGLPLALEVIGSSLYKKSRDIWKSALGEYRRFPPKSIYEILRISYDGLEEYQQKIFLDLACFFKGAPLGHVTHILSHGRDLDAKRGIEELVDKSLIKIDEWNHVIMHDLIQDMGREIVRQESSSPGKRSRLWSSKDIIHVLEENMGSENIEVMLLKITHDPIVRWNGKAFKKMKNLQVLIIESVDFSTEITHLPTSLRLFEWKGYPFLALPSNYFPRNLVTLKLPNSHFILDIPLNNFQSLCHLNLSGNSFLTRLPDIYGAPNLEELWLNDCLNLIEIHDSFGTSSKLRVLCAAGCTNLSIFPPHIRMKSLVYLNLWHCSSLKIFPEIVGKMENLLNVVLDHSGIENLPFSIHNLIGLEHIRLVGCNGLLALPSSILSLPKVASFFVSCCGKFYFYCKGNEQEQERVSPLERSSTRRTIWFKNCNLRDEFLPTRLPFLSDWDLLRIESCNFRIVPVSIKEFPFLKRLELIKCKQLLEIRGLPPSLMELKLIECEQLREIRELPPNIEEVHAPNCKLLTSKSLSILLNRKLHKDKAKFIFLPRARIPIWFHHLVKGPSLSFSFRYESSWVCNKFPSIALFFVVTSPRSTVIGNLNFDLILNGNQRIGCKIRLPAQPFTDHILLFDLKTHIREGIDSLIIKRGWNHVEILGGYVTWMGVYAYEKDAYNNNMDVRFERSNHPRKRKFYEVQGDTYMEYHLAPQRVLRRRLWEEARCDTYMRHHLAQQRVLRRGLWEARWSLLICRLWEARWSLLIGPSQSKRNK